jgi:phosphotriesterase-related protein
MQLMTVTGPIAPEEMGITLPHEHVLIDMNWEGLWPDVSNYPDLVWQSVSLANLGAIRRNYMAVRDNAVQHDIGEMSEELAHFKALGGSTVCDVTTYGLNPSPVGLREISRRSGVHIVAGTGLYLEESLPPEVREMSVEDIHRWLVRDLTQGFSGTDIRAGLIGEVALHCPIKPIEERSLRAAARAQKDTGAVISVHGISPRAVEILREEGADLNRVVADHCDSPDPMERCRPMLDEGIYIEFDCFGYESYCDNGAYDTDEPWYFPRDTDRIKGVKALINHGYVRQILLSHDICAKMQLRRYGGWGYAHILEHIRPMMERIGITEEQFRTMTVDNPACLFPF